jgi:cell division protein YceG involved in septum cleavage
MNLFNCNMPIGNKPVENQAVSFLKKAGFDDLAKTLKKAINDLKDGKESIINLNIGGGKTVQLTLAPPTKENNNTATSKDPKQTNEVAYNFNKPSITQKFVGQKLQDTYNDLMSVLPSGSRITIAHNNPDSQKGV